jgi:pimeloyl-ACP methyl ester carboxylesterase
MYKLLPAVVLLAALSTGCAGQALERHVVNPQDSLSGYYFAMKAANGKIKGAVVLLPGFAGSGESVLAETKIPEAGAAQGLLAVTVALGEKLYADSVVVQKLDLVLNDVRTRYGVAPDRFILGGYSAGGAIALRYAEYCEEKPGAFPIRPRGVFAVDSPIDLFDLWGYFEREIKKNFAAPGVDEAKMAMPLMEREIGTPQRNRQRYEQLTPFHRDLDGAGNERFLKNTAVRVYHDVDINWYLANRRRSLVDMNCLSSSELINRLLLLGNERAEFVVGKTGYRPNGQRHPHSWSIVDEGEFTEWALRLLD